MGDEMEVIVNSSIPRYISGFCHEKDHPAWIPFAILIHDGSPTTEDGLQLGCEIDKFENVVTCNQGFVAEAQSNQGSTPVTLVIQFFVEEIVGQGL